jgi:hypothetical protein
MGAIHEVHHWDGLRWHDIYTKSHDNQFRHLSHIIVITTSWEAVKLVLMIDGIYELCHWHGLRCLAIHIKFHKDWFSHSKDNKGGYPYRHTETHICRQKGDFISLLLLFQNKESRLKIDDGVVDVIVWFEMGWPLCYTKP